MTEFRKGDVVRTTRLVGAVSQDSAGHEPPCRPGDYVVHNYVGFKLSRPLVCFAADGPMYRARDFRLIESSAGDSRDWYRGLNPELKATIEMFGETLCDLRALADCHPVSAAEATRIKGLHARAAEELGQWLRALQTYCPSRGYDPR